MGALFPYRLEGITRSIINKVGLFVFYYIDFFLSVVLNMSRPSYHIQIPFYC